MGNPSQKKTWNTFSHHIEPKSHLVHDKEKSHKVLVQGLKLREETYDSNEIKKLEDKDNPLNLINHQCYLLKVFLKAQPGLNRENLQDYMNLYCFISNPPHNELRKVEFLLTSAIGLTKSLKYTELFSKTAQYIDTLEDYVAPLCR